MNPEDILSQLRIRSLEAPPEIGWWPLAPGWWILIGLTFALILFSLIWAIARHRAYAPYRAAQIEIRHIYQKYLDNTEQKTAAAHFLQESNVVLKRLAAQYEGSEYVANLSGAKWRSYLSELAGAKCSATELDPFEYYLYQPNPSVNADEFISTLNRLTQEIKKRTPVFGKKIKNTPVTGAIQNA